MINKIKVLFILMLLFSIIFILMSKENLIVFSKTILNSSKEIVIVIDPGHANRSNQQKEPISPNSGKMKIKDGGGAAGIGTKTPENEINLNVALKLQDLLKEKGYKVVMTKTDKTQSLGNVERAEIGNRENADLVLRIHCDSHKNSGHFGASMLVPQATNANTEKIKDESSRCGKIILDTLCEEVGIKNRGLIYSDQMTGFNWSKVPVVLVEMGFLSNHNEDRLLSSQSYQEKLAQGLFHGIEKAFDEANN